MLKNVIYLCLLCLGESLGWGYRDGMTTIQINNATVGRNYTEYSVNSTVEYLFEFKKSLFKSKDPEPARVTVECLDATRYYPVLVVLRQAKGVLSWQLPLVVPTKQDRVEYTRTSRTLCPNSNYRAILPETPDEEIIIIISSSSPSNLRFSLRLEMEEDFYVSASQNRSLEISPSEPRFYQFKWPNDIHAPDSVVLQVDSNCEVCMVVSIQNISCPVFDLERTVQFEGYRQTMTTRGGITVTRSQFQDGFYIVLIVKGDDYDCSANSSVRRRSKDVTLSFRTSISYEDFIKASASAFFLYFSVYVIALIVSYIYYWRNGNGIIDVSIDVSTNCNGYAASGSEAENQTRDSSVATASFVYHRSNPDGVSLDSSFDEDDIDLLTDVNFDKDVIRSSARLYLCDLARKNPKILRKKSLMYFWNLLIVATFYALPVVQLVWSSQLVLNQTGNQDLCYYNFLCSYPNGFLSDFNHVYSNIGYIMLGLLFVVLVHRRDRLHCKASAERCELDKDFGIPQHYGFLYAMGAALFMEGFLSGCYHVCPNHSNFQFDTSFMYVISLMCMLKIYHSRHPDINASACATFGVLAIIILVGVAGILSGTFYFWVLFSILHLSMCLWLSGKVYYLGRLQFGFSMFRRAWNVIRREVIHHPTEFFKPRYPSRMVLLILGNMANWGLAAAVWVIPHDISFGTYLLVIFMANLMLYTIFYIGMKYLCKEKLVFQSAAYLILATLGWGFSLYFFFHPSISWTVTPAKSRSFNQPCEIMGFYDKHDIWHFLSAFSMFFSFMTLLTLDDDLVNTHRSQILVF